MICVSLSGNEDCPVALYKEFVKRRPATMLSPESRFYLKPLNNPTTDVWFASIPLGKNTLGNLGKRMALEANCNSEHKTNHSARKTSIQTLLHANIHATDVMQLTGHKNVQSLNSYSHMSLDQQEQISHILSKQLSPAEITHTPSMALSCPDQIDIPLSTVVVENETVDLALPELHFDDFNGVLKPSENTGDRSSTHKLLHNCSFNGNVVININYSHTPNKKPRLSQSDSESEE